jgi:CRP-like cAMP-binding protein/HEAT repeat protein
MSLGLFQTIDENTEDRRMRLKGKLLSLFNIQAGEARLVGLTLAYAILLYVANVLARTASYAIFLTEFDAASLPMAYLGISIATPLVSTVILRLNRQFSLGKVLLGIHIFLLATLAIYRIGLGIAAVPWLLFSLPIYFGVNNSLTISSFWNLLGRIFDLQQGKRLFGLLSAGEHLATIVTGFLAPLLVNWLGTPNLFLVASLAMLVSIVLLNQVIRENAGKMEKIQEQDVPAKDAAAAQGSCLLASPYVRLIIALFALFIIGVYLVDNIFYSQVELQFPDEDALAGFIGIFFGAFGVLSLFIQLFVVGRVLNRFGVRAMILATPAGLLLPMGLFALLGNSGAETVLLFVLITAANLYRLILDAVDSSAVNLMYQPLPAGQRTQAQTTVIGIVYPLAIGAAGLLLLFFTELLGFTPVMLATVSLAVVLIWLGTGIQLGRAYPQQVQQALAQRLFTGGAQLQVDEQALAIIRQYSDSPHLGVVLFAIEMLSQNQPEAMADLLPELLAHADPEVRQEALSRIGSLGLEEASMTVRRHLARETDLSVRATALRTLASLASTMLADIEPFLDHEESKLRQGALAGLLRNADAEMRAEAVKRLKKLAGSPLLVERQLAADTMGQAENPAFETLLAPLLSDPDLTVRRRALAAAAISPALWPAVLEALSLPETRAVAAVSLIAAGEAPLPLLQRAFAAERDQQVLRQLARILRRIGTPGAVNFLSSQLRYPDHGVRQEILEGLHLAGFKAGADQETKALGQIRNEAEWAATAMQTMVDLQEDASREAPFLLQTALKRQVNQHRANSFRLLSMVYETTTIERVWAILKSDGQAFSDQRAYALETLELLLDREMLPIMRSLVSQHPLAQQLDQLRQLFPLPSHSREQRLRSLLDAPDSWLQLCALYEIGRAKPQGEEVGRDILSLALAHDDNPLVWETAVWTLARLDQQTVASLIADSPDAAASTVAQQVGQWQKVQPHPLPTMARVELLLKTTLFGDVHEEALTDIASLMVEQRYAADKTIFSKGMPGDSMYLIVSGKVRVHDGDETWNHLAEAQVFGEIALLDPEPRTASVTAVEPTHILRLNHNVFGELLQSQPGLSSGIIRVLSRYLRARVQDVKEMRKTTKLPPQPAEVKLVTSTRGTNGPVLMSQIERIILMKRVDLFTLLPNNILSELAMLLDGVQTGTDEPIFAKGDAGDALYIIANGRVRIQDEGHTVNELQDGHIFGEMALLDSELRMAGATAVAPTHLLRLEQQIFQQLLQERPEIALPIIKILSKRLRSRLEDLTALRALAS